MENLTGGTPPVRSLPCVVPCKLYFPIAVTTVAHMGHQIYCVLGILAPRASRGNRSYIPWLTIKSALSPENIPSSRFGIEGKFIISTEISWSSRALAIQLEKKISHPHIHEQEKQGVIPACFCSVIHIGAGFLYQWILPIVIGNSVVIQIAVMKPLRLYSPNAFPTVSLVLGLLAPPFWLHLTGAYTVGNEIAGFPEAGNNGLVVPAAMFTVDKPVSRGYLLVREEEAVKLSGASNRAVRG